MRPSLGAGTYALVSRSPFFSDSDWMEYPARFYCLRSE